MHVGGGKAHAGEEAIANDVEAATGTAAKARSPVATTSRPATSMVRAPKRSARLPAMGENIAMTMKRHGLAGADKGF